MRFIGDVHNSFREYRKAVKTAVGPTLQLGDLGHDYVALMDLDSNNHKFIAGNHDNYDVIDRLPHYLGKYGIWNTPIGDIFYMSGAWSIDKAYRLKYENITRQKVWWYQEELDILSLNEAFKLYKEVFPEIVATHCCPQEIVKHCTDPAFQEKWGHPANVELTNKTSNKLQNMFDFHQPKLWIFGHYHTFKDFVVNGTRFICVNRIPDDKWFVDINQNLEVY